MVVNTLEYIYIYIAGYLESSFVLVPYTCVFVSGFDELVIMSLLGVFFDV